MNTIRKGLLQLIFSGAYMLRWNDKQRASELYEIDKQGHKMLLACALWQQNSQHLGIEAKHSMGQKIIEGGLFDYLYRMVITDIKPPVFYRIKEKPEHFRQLTEYVIAKLEPIVAPLDSGFWQRFCEYHRQPDDSSQEARILSAAHLYASRWEFNCLRPLNSFDEEMPHIERSFQNRLDSLRDVAGVPALLEKENTLARFANICGMLRFQIRWTQVPRIPATSVLGHMFLVATYAYCYSLTIHGCTARCNNNFFCGLFHDLPELLTRDIISPVKRSVPLLPELIREYEEQELESHIFAPLRKQGFDGLANDIGYYLGLATGSEFFESTRVDGVVKRIDDFSALHSSCNANALDPKDGELIKVCDTLAAFLEASNSLRHGVSSAHLVQAAGNLRKTLQECSINELELGALMADFD
jgi:putative hydrolases of HD superfamily